MWIGNDNHCLSFNEADGSPAAFATENVAASPGAMAVNLLLNLNTVYPLDLSW
ncbi:MAG: hypothetical protein MJK13_15160 [Pseudomonadales bacterium]|nr:hypothetical protein [Pseudomonadales bacterium]